MYLVAGANGQLGSELKDILKEKGIYVDKEELDITNDDSVSVFFKKNKNIKVIINCAAYTAVDKAENDLELATKINVEGPKNLAKTGLPIVQISTDYVFDGNKNTPYNEEDIANPKSIYGQTKLDGEKEVLKNAKTAVIIRTAWLYSTYGNNFVKTMIRLGKEKEFLNVVFDQVGTPTYAADLAQAIVDILPQIKDGTKEIYHFSNEGVCSWYDFSTEIMKANDLKCKVHPIESKDYPTAAKRPSFSVLNKNKIKKTFNIKINHWRDSLNNCLKKIK